MIGLTTNLLRTRQKGQHARVEFVELFFDLVFVFAITQLSHNLLHHPDLHGALDTGLLLLAVWWVWMYTSWATNWFDPARVPIRFMMFALMALGLIMSASIPEAFADRALAFAGAYGAMQVGRTAFITLATVRHNPNYTLNFLRITLWLAVAALIWIAGALVGGEWQRPLWFLAVVIEYAGPWAFYWVPGLGRSNVESWDVDPAHMAERCGLFVIIALGESILLTGSSFSGLEWSSEIIAGMAVALSGALAMWWIYFSIGQSAGLVRFSEAKNTGELARLAYTYLHLPIVAGIIVSAAGDEIIVSHPLGHISDSGIAFIAGGSALYLFGNLLFKMAFFRNPPLSHLAGIAFLAALAFFGHAFSPLLLGACCSLVLIVVAVWEHASLTTIRQEIHQAEHH